MPPPVKITKGQKFGMLAIVKEIPSRKRKRWFSVRCDCGKATERALDMLRQGKSTHCGCQTLATYSIRQGTDTHSPEYVALINAIARCHRPSHPNFSNYGGRGIFVCDEWRGPDGFDRFIDFVGQRPGDNFSLHRIDNDDGYRPGNVEWADGITQGNEKRTSKKITVEGETLTVTQWERKLGKSRNTIGCIIQRYGMKRAVEYIQRGGDRRGGARPRTPAAKSRLKRAKYCR